MVLIKKKIENILSDSWNFIFKKIYGTGLDNRDWLQKSCTPFEGALEENIVLNGR